MRRLLDVTCPRCGFRSSTEGLSYELAYELGQQHVCADGVATPCSEPVERVVLGPGERTKLPEERN